MKRFFTLICIFGLTMGVVACSDDDDELFNNEEPNASENNDEPNNDEPNNDEPNNDEPNTGENACEPVTCDEINQECGVVDDGCGGELDCGECACTEEDFLDSCPTRPCEQVVGCGSGECEYEPIEASDGTTCTECPGGDCGNTTVRYCNFDDDDVCPQYYCDPDRETDDAGRTVYNNEIIDSHTYQCGTCDLGYQVCDSGSFSSEDITVDNVDPDFAECDDTQTGSTFLYVDASYSGGDSDGSRTAPFQSLDAALVEANQRNAEALILGGSGTYEGPVNLRSGISIIGGYDARPDWTRNPDQTPVISAPSSAVEDDLLVAMRAMDITDNTHLKDLRIETDDMDDEDGVSTAALVIDNAPGLKLESVVLEAGAAGDGLDGEDGSSSSSSGGHGEDGEDGQAVGSFYHDFGSYLFTDDFGTGVFDMPDMTAAGTNPDCPDADGGQGARGDDFVDEDVQPFETAHLPGENSAAGECVNPFGSPGNPLYDADNECGGRLYESGSFEYDDQNGRDGLPHSGTADSGDDGDPEVSISSGTGLVLEGHGGSGAQGEAGRGGGGGASGQGRYESGPDQLYLGASGGGGGAGGCGGEGGEGGRAGGWSIGVIAEDTSGTSLIDVQIIANDGGEGGLGGQGGEGASGGVGGSGGDQVSAQSGFGDEGNGTDGGDGSAGQTGGDGGSGAGGSSVAMVCPESDASFVSEGSFDLSVGAAGASAGFSGLEQTNLNCTID